MGLTIERFTPENDDSPETLGFIQLSIISSIMALSREGVSKQTITGLKANIDGIQSTLWSLAVLSIKHKDGDKNLNDAEEILNYQLDGLIKDIKENFKRWKSEKH